MRFNFKKKDINAGQLVFEIENVRQNAPYFLGEFHIMFHDLLTVDQESKKHDRVESLVKSNRSSHTVVGSLELVFSIRKRHFRNKTQNTFPDLSQTSRRKTQTKQIEKSVENEEEQESSSKVHMSMDNNNKTQ